MVFILFGMFVWLAVVSALLIRTISHYNNLTKGISKRGLSEVLDAIVGLLKQVEVQTKDTDKAVQRIGLVRFNPFSDTGGAQSFTIALLDKQNCGIVMTSLHGRSGNRWYVKEVRHGKGKDVELSKEELTAIEKAGKSA